MKKTLIAFIALLSLSSYGNSHLDKQELLESCKQSTLSKVGDYADMLLRGSFLIEDFAFAVFDELRGHYTYNYTNSSYYGSDQYDYEYDTEEENVLDKAMEHNITCQEYIRRKMEMHKATISILNLEAKFMVSSNQEYNIDDIYNNSELENTCRNLDERLGKVFEIEKLGDDYLWDSHSDQKYNYKQTIASLYSVENIANSVEPAILIKQANGYLMGRVLINVHSGYSNEKTCAYMLKDLGGASIIAQIINKVALEAESYKEEPGMLTSDDEVYSGIELD